MFRCPYCNTLHLRNVEVCRLCHSTFIDPSEYGLGEDVRQRYKDSGVMKLF